MSRHFIVRMVIFFFLSGGIFGAMTLVDSHVRADRPLYSQRETFLSRQAATVLVLGDSHPASAVDQELLPPHWMNFSYPGDTLRDAYAKLQFASSVRRIRAIVLQMDFATFATNRNANRNTCAVMRMIDRKTMQSTFDYTFAAWAWQRFECFLPLLNKGEREKFIINISNLLLGRTQSKQNKRQEGGSLAGDVNKALGGNIAEPSVVKILEKLLRFAALNDIQVIGVRYPMSMEFLEDMKAYDMQPYQTVIRDHPTDSFVDFTHVLDADQSAFRDLVHLSPEGARRFTPVFIRNISVKLRSE